MAEEKMTAREREAYEQALRRIQECKREGSRGTILQLSGMGLTYLPPEIGQLTALRELYLEGNSLTSLPPEIGQLAVLTQLYLEGNSLTSLPTEIYKLSSLQTLDLANTQLSTLSPQIGRLSSLVALYLDDNELRSLPLELTQLSHLRELYLLGNPGLNLPGEVLGPTWRNVRHGANPASPKAILDYYFRTLNPDQALPLNEFKLILVGRGGVGKTTLIEKLVSDDFKTFDKTPGIKITQWPVTIERDDVRAHVWDFGGQEIMHGTHRFFMTERALYVTLITGREGTEDQDAEYWLSLIRSFGGDVPVLVLLHKWSEQKFELNRELLREKYGKNITFLETDSGATKNQEKNINKLRELICQQAAALPGLKAKWPKAWREVKQELPEQKRSWMTYAEFQKFCAAHGVPEAEDQEALATSLHDLGLMLAYRKDEALRGFGVLHPTWVTDGIYRMLNDEALQERRGRFKPADFATVLPKQAYPAKLYPYLLELMQKFRLCFPLDDAAKEYLIPELLSKREPELEGEFPPETSLCFAYQYDTVLPEGLLPRFIVETHVQREIKHAWKTGVVLERGNCRALVRGDLQARKISIRVTGTGRGELWGFVREHFERIHRDYSKLPVTELVPVPGHPDVVLEYRELLGFEADGVTELHKWIGGKTVRLRVKDLLDGVDVGGVRRASDKARTEFIRSVDGTGAPKVFISYSHTDARFLEEFKINLSLYERKAEIEVWSDPLIESGQEWRKAIFTKLDEADIFVLLLSPTSVASDFVIDKELPRAEERRQAGKCEIMPVLIKPCLWKKLDMSDLQVVRPNGRAVSQARDRDAAWVEVTQELDKVIARVKAKQAASEKR